MENVNAYDLLSEAIEDGIGNTSSQKENVSKLFIDGLFSDADMTIRSVDGQNGIEYHVMFDGYEAMGETPALAVKNLIQGIIAYYDNCHF